MDTSEFFKVIFNNAKLNGIIIMNKDGAILNINKAFHAHFGYVPEDLTGKSFSILFTEKDKQTYRPERELQTVLTEGSANDENYLVKRDGSKVWVSGESVLIENNSDETYIVKVVHNIHAQKQLERFLIESHEFIDTIFDSINESALLLLDSRLRVIKSNKTFVEMFELKQPVAEGCRLSELDNAFWQRPDVKQEMVNFLVTQDVRGIKTFELQTKSGEMKKITFQAKLIEGIRGAERKLLIMIKIIS